MLTDLWSEDEGGRRAELAAASARRRRQRWSAIVAAFESAPGAVIRLGGAVRGRFERAADALAGILGGTRASAAQSPRWRPWGGALVRTMTRDDLAAWPMPARERRRWIDKAQSMRRF